MSKEAFENIYKTLNKKLITKRKFYNIEDYNEESNLRTEFKNNEYVNDFYNEYKTGWINKHPKYKDYIDKDINDIYEILINEKPVIKDINDFANRLLINFNHDEQEYILNNRYGEYNKQNQYLNEKMEIGLLPYAQAMLLARYIRQDIDDYPVFIVK